jgi:hypothetical protein
MHAKHCGSDRLWAEARLAIVAVGQQAHQPALPHPLGLAAAQELVEDDLRWRTQQRREMPA